MLYLLGLALLIISAVYLLNASHSIVREECKQLCDAVGMDYKIRRSEKRWWEVWK